MEEVFIKLINMSLTASIVVFAVILLRFLLKKAPKWIMGVLWGCAAFRLVFPFSFESIFSLIPNTEPIQQNIFTQNNNSSTLNDAVNTVNPIVGGYSDPTPNIVFIASVIWLIGLSGMLIYTMISYLRIRRKVSEAIQLKENIWICDRISTPFILGILRPRIYMPSSMNESDAEFVLSHERAHLKRKDHIWKPLGFLLLSVYWFNPILWTAYILFCRDIELACDERVIRQSGTEIKKQYSNALINCSVPKKMISACPLAFGETSIKERVKGVLSYKKPAFWVIIAAVVVCIITAVCLLTNPKTNNLDDSLQVFLDTQIAEHNKSEHSEGDFIAVDYEILKTDRWLSDTTLYMWVYYSEYSYENGELKQVTASHTPTVISVTNTNSNDKNGKNSYELKKYWIPGDGSQFENDIKENFPEALWGKATDSQRYIDKQQAKCLEAALEYYGISDSDNGADGLNGNNYSVVKYYYDDVIGEKKANRLAADEIYAIDRNYNFYASNGESYMNWGTLKILTDTEETEKVIKEKLPFYYQIIGFDKIYTDSDAHKFAIMNNGDIIYACISTYGNAKRLYAISVAKLKYSGPFDFNPSSIIGGADEPNNIIVDSGSNPYFNAEVIELSGKSVLVKPDSDTKEIESADRISVSADVISTIPVPDLKVGDRVRIVYNGEIAETYPGQIRNIFAIYLLSDDNKVVYPSQSDE